jgi:Putative regulator of cell autolysis
MENMSLKLLAADKMKDEFLIITSHEFKTPLNAIINIAQVVLDQTNDLLNKKSKEDLSYIKSTAIRLSGLINDIIDFQSLQNNSLLFQKETFDVNGAVRVALEVLQYLKKSDDIQLINNIPPDIYYVFTDENRFQQILFNLVGNSLKFTDKGRIQINAEVKEAFLYIHITDTGIGIEKQQQAILFSGNRYQERQYPVHEFSESQYSSNEQFTYYTTSGLGLPVSKLLANQMDGDLYLEWSTPEIGSSFILKIPVSSYSKKKPDPSFTEGTELPLLSRLFKIPVNKEEDSFIIQNGSNEKVKLLLVDDSASNIKVLQEIFRLKGYETLAAYSGTSALELIKTHKDISLILLDVMMPGLTGYDVCKEIRKKYQLFELPVLLLTVRNYPEDIEKGLESGANDFLIKPFNTKELKARVATLLEIKKTVHNAITMESAFLQSQIKPHFLYNTLNIITSLCYSDGERAGMLLGELSNYLRGAFEVDPHNSFISLEKEISLVESYAKLNKARFGERLQINFHIEEAVLSKLIPAFIIQPLVENSIRHGLMKQIAGGEVEVSAAVKEGRLLIMVRDNGSGISEDRLALLFDDNYSGSIGLKNVNKRLVNEYGEGLHLESKVGEGTTIYISIPL